MSRWRIGYKGGVGRSIRSQRVDDIDGSPAACTVAFALDGRRYEIDLSDRNAAALRGVFAPYVAVARKAGAKRAATVPKAGPARRREAPPEPPEQPLAPVVPLPVRPPEQQVSAPDIAGQRRRLATDIGELTRVVAVAVLAAATDRLVGMLVPPAKASDTAHDASSAAPAGGGRVG